VEVKIGIQMAPRELVIETDTEAADIQHALTTAISEGSLFVISDNKRGTLLIPADKIAYVELSPSEQRRIGFGA
jgi:Protein of unknown function (DUF3107)